MIIIENLWAIPVVWVTMVIAFSVMFLWPSWIIFALTERIMRGKYPQFDMDIIKEMHVIIALICLPITIALFVSFILSQWS